MIVGSNSGHLIILKYDAKTNSFMKNLHQEIWNIISGG